MMTLTFSSYVVFSFLFALISLLWVRRVSVNGRARGVIYGTYFLYHGIGAAFYLGFFENGKAFIFEVSTDTISDVFSLSMLLLALSLPVFLVRKIQRESKNQ